MPESDGPRTAVIVGGCGAIGTMFAEKLAGSGVRVVSIDLVNPSPESRVEGVEYKVGDVTAHGESEIPSADMVMLALPHDVIESCLGYVSETMRPGSLLVETSSVKASVTANMRDVSSGIEAMGVNPMFSPSAGSEGRPVAVVTVSDGPLGRGLVQLMTEWGMVPVPVEAEYHDRLTAATQVATHAAVLAYGLTLTDLGVDIDDLSRLATPPNMTLLALLARITSAAPEVYWDIQAENPRAPLARHILSRNMADLSVLLAGSDQDGFDASLGKIRDFLGEHRPALDETCVRVFSQLHTWADAERSDYQ